MSSFYADDNSYGGYNPRVHARFAEREGYHLASGSEEPRTIFVGNLASSVNEELLATLFNQMGVINKVKVVFDGVGDPFGFVEFKDHTQASQALQMMNGRKLMEKEMRVSWAIEPGQSTDYRPRQDTSRHFHVFVGDLSTEIDSAKLRDAFAPFGEISDAKIIKDTVTSKTKGYGFVSYPRREDAERAIEQMNGQWLGRRTIRTNWATRKPEDEDHHHHRGGAGGGGGHRHFEKTYDEIYNLAASDNTSVYVGNINALSEEEIRRAFERFGSIYDVRIFKVQGYAFVKFAQKESAAKAILQMNNQEIQGQLVRCSWGKSGDSNKTVDSGRGSLSGAYGYGYGHGASSGGGGAGGGGAQHQYPSHFGTGGGAGVGGQSAGTAAGVNNQYWQYYAQYYNNPQLMQQWSTYWQGVKHGNGAPQAGGGGPKDEMF